VASVNKQSLREEFDALKGRFEQLIADGKMAGEGRALVEALLMLLQLLMAVFMEQHTPQDQHQLQPPNFPELPGPERDRPPGHARQRQGARSGG
jgi:hypothetical protein